jgi:hypothetical protein
MDVWADRDLLVLREVVACLDKSASATLSAEHLAEKHLNDFTVDEVCLSLKRLEKGGYVTYPPVRSRIAGWRPGESVADYTGRALPAIGTWPSPELALDRLVAALSLAAENADDEETRTALSKVARTLRTSAATIGLNVASAVISGQLPGT